MGRDYESICGTINIDYNQSQYRKMKEKLSIYMWTNNESHCGKLINLFEEKNQSGCEKIINFYEEKLSIYHICGKIIH